MIRRFILGALALHIAYAVFWIVLGAHSEMIVERWAVAIAATVLTLGYCVLVVGFWRARKSRLNIALAVNKFYLLLLFGVLTLPILWGVIYYDAPYRENPYSFWVSPPWLRTYIYMGTSISVIGVLYEFWRANWGGGRTLTWPAIDRRTRPFGRRSTDQAAP